jgi:hypothetical protein
MIMGSEPAMIRTLARHRVVLIGLAVLACLLAAGAVGLWSAYLPGDYPGATRASSDTRVRYVPSLVLRRTSTYRSSDPFPDVYNWYSKRFSLGPESHAQGGCILMGRSFTTLWVVKEQITVTVCGTPNGQMMFVDRSSVLTYLRW